MHQILCSNFEGEGSEQTGRRYCSWVGELLRLPYMACTLWTRLRACDRHRRRWGWAPLPTVIFFMPPRCLLPTASRTGSLEVMKCFMSIFSGRRVAARFISGRSPEIYMRQKGHLARRKVMLPLPINTSRVLPLPIVSISRRRV